MVEYLSRRSETMLGYYLRVAALSMRNNSALSTLVVCTIGIGIGTCTTFVNVRYVMGKDPIPEKSSVLYAVQLDAWDGSEPANPDGPAPIHLTYRDGMALMDGRSAYRQAAMARTAFVVEPPIEVGPPFVSIARATSSGFFDMFDTPFRYGNTWGPAADRNGLQVVVLSRQMNERLFGGRNSVGKAITLGGRDYRVVGVLDEWSPFPKFYDLDSGSEAENMFVPFGVIPSLGLRHFGTSSCWEPLADGSVATFLASECVWVQFWVELRNSMEVESYMDFLDSYAMEQKLAGRFQRNENNRVLQVNDWLAYRGVVDPRASALMVMSSLFLVVCLVSAGCVLLSLFVGRADEVYVRRALGASRRSIVAQFLVNSSGLGAAGALLGGVFAYLGLWWAEVLFGDAVDKLVVMDFRVLTVSIVSAVALAVLSGAYPAWRASSISA